MSIFTGAGVALVTPMNADGSVNFENDESVAYFQRTLRKRGIIDALVEAGCREGDTVCVIDIEFEYKD